jgi:restriction endonuclease Mrr
VIALDRSIRVASAGLGVCRGARRWDGLQISGLAQIIFNQKLLSQGSFVNSPEMTPDAFQRLVKRMLREAGFAQVEVTGRSGDGGIDGKGIVRVGDLPSFHVLFQCKRYQGSVSPSAIRDFRGALVGRADKGPFVTT